MNVFAEKRKELSQTIVLLIDTVRKEKGCLSCDFYQSLEDENRLCIHQKWDSKGSFDNHLKSDHFKVLSGAMNLLKEPREIIFYTVAAGKKRM